MIYQGKQVELLSARTTSNKSVSRIMRMKFEKKIVISPGVTLGILILGAILGLLLANSTYNGLAFDDSNLQGSVEDLNYFRSTYDENRQSFLEDSLGLQKLFPQVQISRILVPSARDRNLTIDLTYLPSQEKNKLVIISSGIHGVEGFAGSAVQRMVMKEILPAMKTKDTAFLFIHGINPYGFKYLRRVTENNVDLNRNSGVDTAMFSTKNQGYKSLYDFLNPAKALDRKSPEVGGFFLGALGQVALQSIAKLRQAILQGQYEFPEGIYFGGRDFEPQIKSLTTVLAEVVKPYKSVMALDIHTGYGERGKTHLFPIKITDPKALEITEKLYSGTPVDWPDSKGFYTVYGDFTELVQALAKDKLYLPMTLEYGTMNSQDLFGLVKSLQIMIMENQGMHQGYAQESDRSAITQELMEMYYPSSAPWRTVIIKDTRNLLNQAFKIYSEMKL